ncbi:Magnesium transporter NIPA3 [Mactra antiquata]
MDNLTTPNITTNFTTSTEPLPSSTTPYTESEAVQQRNFWIGLGFAVGSSFFIGTSFILQKLGLLNVANKEGEVRASDGGHKYLLQWKWWLGLFLMFLGESCNLVAFAFAPATLVTPLGALSVIFSAVLASYFLNEGLNLLGKLGCVLCVLGSTVVVIHSPKYTEVQNMHDLLLKVQQPAVLTLAAVFIVSAAIGIIFFAPRWGSSNVVVYVFICSTLGALTVMGCKGVAVAVKETIAGKNEFVNWLTYVMLGIAVINILFQLNFLNKALDTFNTAVVTPTYYVMFTSCVTILSLVLYNEFGQMTIKDIIGDVCGFLTIVVGIFMLNAFKDMKIDYRSLPKSKKKEDTSVTIEVSPGGEVSTISGKVVPDKEAGAEPAEIAENTVEGVANPAFVDGVDVTEVQIEEEKGFSNGHVKRPSDYTKEADHTGEITHF